MRESNPAEPALVRMMFLLTTKDNNYCYQVFIIIITVIFVCDAFVGALSL
jgi:hypothetical protein